MPDLTESERLFAELCSVSQITCARIEEGTSVTADYAVDLGDSRVIVEVKQLDPNQRDRVAHQSLESGLCQGGIAPSRRVRDQIAKAYRQLKPYAGDDLPCIVVLFNNAGFLNRIDSFTVTTAMFGTFVIGLGLGNDNIIRPVSQGFGGGRKLTRNTCRGISAVCVLYRSSSGNTALTAYHNPFAQQPIEPLKMTLLASQQFRHASPHSGRFNPLMPAEVVV